MDAVGNCPLCGSEARVMTSNGGPYLYWRVECVACGFNTRGPGTLRGLAGLGFNHISPDAPQNSREEALERWQTLRVARSTPAPSESATNPGEPQ